MEDTCYQDKGHSALREVIGPCKGGIDNLDSSPRTCKQGKETPGASVLILPTRVSIRPVAILTESPRLALLFQSTDALPRQIEAHNVRDHFAQQSFRSFDRFELRVVRVEQTASA